MMELKACPFCGSDGARNQLEDVDMVGCVNPTCICSEMSWTSTNDWNTRPIEDALRSENQRLREALEEAVSALSKAPNTNNYDWEHWRVEFCIKHKEALQ